jgi:hypothetical protein
MRVLPAASLDFSKKQLLLRLNFYGLKKDLYSRLTKPAILGIIELVETEATRELK